MEFGLVGRFYVSGERVALFCFLLICSCLTVYSWIVIGSDRISFGRNDLIPIYLALSTLYFCGLTVCLLFLLLFVADGYTKCQFMFVCCFMSWFFFFSFLLCFIVCGPIFPRYSNVSSWEVTNCSSVQLLSHAHTIPSNDVCSILLLS